MNKRLGVAISIIIVVIIILASLYLIFQLQESDSDKDDEILDSDGDGVPDEHDDFPNNPDEYKDSDGDGIGSYTDLWDNGNAGIKIRIESCYVYSHLDEADNDPDPYFIIKMDYESDGVYEIVWESLIYDDGAVPDNEIEVKRDVRDDLENITFIIEAWDKDQVTDDEVMDYSGSPELYWESHDIVVGPVISNGNYFTFAELYETDGSDDNNSGENDCKLRYWIEVYVIE